MEFQERIWVHRHVCVRKELASETGYSSTISKVLSPISCFLTFREIASSVSAFLPGN